VSSPSQIEGGVGIASLALDILWENERVECQVQDQVGHVPNVGRE